MPIEGRRIPTASKFQDSEKADTREEKQQRNKAREQDSRSRIPLKEINLFAINILAILFRDSSGFIGQGR
jgi:hypothetical protein